MLQQLEDSPRENRISLYQDLAWEYKNFDLDSSIYFIKEALVLANATHSKKDQYETLDMYGTIETNKGNYDRASELYFQAIEVASSARPPINTAVLFFNRSTLYSKLGEKRKAILDYLHGLAILPGEKQTAENLAHHYTEVSNLYRNVSQHDSADYFLSKAKGLLPEVQSKNVLASTYQAIGGDHLAKSEIDSSIYYFQKSLELYKELDDLKWEATLMKLLGAIYYQNLNQPQYAIDQFFKPSLAIFRKIKNRTEILDVFDWLSYAYEEVSADSAYTYLSEYVVLKEELMEEEKLDKIQELEARYEVATLAREKAEFATQRNGLLAISVLLALVVLSFAFQYQRTRIRRVLESQRSEEQKQLLLERLKNQEITSMNAMMEIQGNERKRIAADLHDRVGSLLATLKVNYESMEGSIQALEPKLSENFIKTNKILDQACKDVRSISHDINSGILTEFGLVPAIEEIKEAIERSGKMVINLDTFGIDKRLESTQEIFLYRIVQETITNVIKHANASEIDIQLSRNDNEISLIIEDNGRGFDPAAINKKKAGMGLGNLKMRVEQLGGEFSIDSMPGRGSSIMVDVPVNQEKKI